MYNINSMKCNNTFKLKRNTDVDTLITIYVIILTLFASLLFLYGFIPSNYNQDGLSINQDIPKYVEQYRVKTKELYKPVVDKLVIFLIDALRWDFISNQAMKNAMPNLHNFIENDKACIFQATVTPPTVTMPRIKAMASGTIPGFLDIIFNLGSNEYKGDSVLLQVRNNGKKIVFYGDDTWLKLFPGLFERYDGTTSFFVTDYTEVDNNVTRHVDEELNNKDWTIMILHYLGLDHIGHTEGPYSSLIKPKLKEMDKVIGHIQKQIAYWDRNGISGTIMICGDHGMKDSGGHGGSSLQETLVPVIFVGTKCSSKLHSPTKIAQIDLASTLSVLLGVPIPRSNIGTIPLEILNSFPDAKKLFILYYNSKQIFQHFQKISDYKSTNAYKNYITAIKLHGAWINTNGQNNDIINDIIEVYTSALIDMKNILSGKLVKCNILIAISGIIFLLHALHVIFTTKSLNKFSNKTIWPLCFSYFILYFSLKHFLGFDDNHESDSKETIIFAISTIAYVSTAHFFLSRYTERSIQVPPINTIKLFDKTQCMFYLGSLLHIISLGSSSFIEEEHQIWYFLWTTFLSLVLIEKIKNVAYFLKKNNGQSLRHFITIIFSLVMHRILRKLNNTGNKYTHIPDFSDWLTDEESKIPMSIILMIGLFLLIYIGCKTEIKKHKLFTLIFYSATSLCIYTRHMNNNSVIKIFNYDSNWMPNEIYVFWLLLALNFMYNIISSEYSIHTNGPKFDPIYEILRLWIMIAALLHRPYNVILLPLQLINSYMIDTTLKDSKNFIKRIQYHIWLGYIFYFYQGNSNNFATIDVASGYIGLESYNPIITGTFLIINTFSATILSYFISIHKILKSENDKQEAVLKINKQFIIWRLLAANMCFIIVAFQRHHLFIWSVFFPKLLYEVAHTIVLYVIILTTVIFVKFTSFVH